MSIGSGQDTYLHDNLIVRNQTLRHRKSAGRYKQATSQNDRWRALPDILSTCRAAKLVRPDVEYHALVRKYFASLFRNMSPPKGVLTVCPFRELSTRAVD